MFPTRPIPTFLIGWALAALLGGGSMVWLLRRAGLSRSQTAVYFLATVAALIIGSKLLYLAEVGSWRTTDRGAMATALLSPQLRIPGGLLLAVAVGPLLARAIRVPYLRIADTVIPAAGLLIVGIRIGCFLAGCCFGTPSSLPWAVSFPATHPPSEVYWWQLTHALIGPGSASTLPVHPLQLYFALVGLALFAGLTAYQSRARYTGEILMIFGLVYLWSTWLLELLRAQPHDFTRSLVLLGSLAMTAAAATVEWRQRRLPSGTARGPAVVAVFDDR